MNGVKYNSVKVQYKKSNRKFSSASIIAIYRNIILVLSVLQDEFCSKSCAFTQIVPTITAFQNKFSLAKRHVKQFVLDRLQQI
jgi:hypothetical protein